MRTRPTWLASFGSAALLLSGCGSPTDEVVEGDAGGEAAIDSETAGDAPDAADALDSGDTADVGDAPDGPPPSTEPTRYPRDALHSPLSPAAVSLGGGGRLPGGAGRRAGRWHGIGAGGPPAGSSAPLRARLDASRARGPAGREWAGYRPPETPRLQPTAHSDGPPHPP